MRKNYIQGTLILLIAVILQSVATKVVFGYSDKEIVDGIRKKIVYEQTYKFGDEYKFVLKDEQAVLLKCLENPDGIDSVLICLTADFLTDFASDYGWSKLLYIYMLHDGEIKGGGSPIPNNIGAIRGVGKAAAIAKWNINNERIRGLFVLTDNRQTLTEKFTNMVTNGWISSTGNWQEKIDFDLMRLTPNEQVEGFVRLWAEIKYNFANFDLVPDLNWDQVLTEYLPRVQREQTLREYNRLLSECVSRLKDGHTDVSTRFCNLFDDAQPALRVQPIEDKAVITEVGQSPEVVKAGLCRGDEITHIDGRVVRDILERSIYPYIFASTTQDRNARAFKRLLLGPPKSEIILRIRNLGGRERDVKLTRQLYWRKQMPVEESRLVEYMDLGDGIAYVAINTFNSSEVVGEFDKLMGNICEAKGLIIDVRVNNGGDSSNGDAIISRLITKPIPGTLWKTPQHIAAFNAWKRPKKWFMGEGRMIEPQQGKRYLGPLVILMGPQTVSAAEDFIVPLHASGRATLVGEKTAGTTGQPLQFEFSHIIRGRVCTKRDTYPDGKEFVGVGVIPDIEVHPTQKDIYDGRDAILEKALQIIKERVSLHSNTKASTK